MTNDKLVPAQNSETSRKPRDFYATAIPLVFGRDRCAPKKDAADVAEKSKSYRLRLGRRLPGTLASGWKHRLGGGWERRPRPINAAGENNAPSSQPPP